MRIPLCLLAICALCGAFALPARAQSAGTGNAVSLAAEMLFPGRGVTDVWGYVEPTTGVPYAIVGWSGGVMVIDVRDPARPFTVAEVSGIPGFDVKVWGSYVYTVTGGGGTGGIVDLSNVNAPVVAGSFPSSHNIFIDDAGFLYAAAPGLKIYDLNPDPLNPMLVWDDGLGAGHDATVVGDRLYDFHGRSGTFIYDATDRAAPVFLGAITDPSIAYHHSGWPSADGRYLFITDELARHPTADITVWDIADPANPTRVAEIADPAATAHNLYIRGEVAYASYYTAGFKTYDIADPTNPIEIGQFDTDPSAGEGFSGAFGTYPFTPGGQVYVSGSSSATGQTVGSLHILSVDTGTLSTDTAPLPDGPTTLRLDAAFPNPFADAATLRFTLDRPGSVTLRVYDLLGRLVATLAEGAYPAGTHTAVLDATALPDGLYLARLTTPTGTATRPLTRLR